MHDWFATLAPDLFPSHEAPQVVKSDSQTDSEILSSNATQVNQNVDADQPSDKTHSATADEAMGEVPDRQFEPWLPIRPLQSISRPAMACEFEVLLNERQYQQGVEVAVEALGLVSRIEDLLSVYRPQSQFSKLNQFATQRPVQVDTQTLELIQLAIDAHRWTAGCFDITAGSLSEAWGFSRRQGTMPSQQQIAQALKCVGTQHIEVDSQASTVRLTQPDVKLNPGGIGKGYALDQVAQFLIRHDICDFMIHGGLSSIVARGRRHSADTQWTVALKHPWRTEELLETIPLHNQAIGTSGSGKQFFHFGGKRYSHLIDPRSGWPADQMMSVTVICPSCGVADAIATALFVMGVESAVNFCDQNPYMAAVLIYTHPKSGSMQIEHRNWNVVQ